MVSERIPTVVSERMKQRTAHKIKSMLIQSDIYIAMETDAACKARLTTSRRELVSMAKKLGITQYIS